MTFLSRNWSDVDWWHCNVWLTVGLRELSRYYANQEKKHVTCPPLGRMLFQLIARPRSQAEKTNRLLAVDLNLKYFFTPYGCLNLWSTQIEISTCWIKTPVNITWVIMDVKDFFWPSLVRYGDMIPITTLGKILGSLCCLSGIIMLALPIPIIQEGSLEIRES